MSISFRGAKGTNGYSTTVKLTVPTGTALGDCMIASFSLNDTGSFTITPPSGWTLIESTTTNYTLVSYYRIAGASEPTTYTWGVPNHQWAGGIATYTGVDTTTTLSGTPVSATSSSSTSSFTATSMTTLDAGALVIVCVGLHANHVSYSITPPLGFTERWDQNWSGSASHVCEISDEIQPIAGATGTLTASGSNSADHYSTQTFALKPSGSGSGGGSGMFDVDEVPVI